MSDVLSEHVDAVRRYCRSRTASDADAQDAVQDTFLRYLQREHQGGNTIDNLEAWLIRAASRACVDVNRRVSRDATIADLAAQSRREEDPEDAVLARAVVAQLRRALSDADRLLLVRLYVCDWTPAQVAAAMGVPAGTVRGMAFRARSRARQALDQLAQSLPSAATDAKPELAIAPSRARRLRLPRRTRVDLSVYRVAV